MAGFKTDTAIARGHSMARDKPTSDIGRIGSFAENEPEGNGNNGTRLISAVGLTSERTFDMKGRRFLQLPMSVGVVFEQDCFL